MGVEGVGKILLRAVNAFSENPRVPFSTKEQAMEWLVNELIKKDLAWGQQWRRKK